MCSWGGEGGRRKGSWPGSRLQPIALHSSIRVHRSTCLSSKQRIFSVHRTLTFVTKSFIPCWNRLNSSPAHRLPMGRARLAPQPRPLFLRTDRRVAAPAIVLESHSALARRRHARPDAEPLSLTSVQRPGLALSPNPPSRAFVRPRRHSPDAAMTPRFRPVHCPTAEIGARYGYPLDRHHPSDVSLDRGGRVL